MRLRRSLARVVLACTCAVALVTCDALNAPEVKNVQLALTSDTVLVLRGLLLVAVEATVDGQPITSARYSLSSSDSGVVDLRGDTLVGAGRGTATVTARLLGSVLPDPVPTVSGTVRVVVRDVTMAPGTATLTSLGDTVRLVATAWDANDAQVEATPTWSSSNTGVVSVSASGLVTAAANGTATVRAVVDDDTASATVTVQQALVEFGFTPGSLFFTSLGASGSVTAQARDARANAIAGITPTWLSRNPGVATVTGAGVVTALGNGATYVIASSGDVADSLQVVVDQAATQVVITAAQGTSITAIGGQLHLSAGATDGGGNTVTDAPVNWATLDPTVALVSSLGQVTGIGVGSARITASLDAASDTVEIVVTNEPVTLVVTPAEATLASLDDTLRASAVVRNGLGDVIQGLTVVWTTPDTSVLTVLSDGRAIAVGVGAARLVAAVGSVADTASVFVTNAPAYLDITSGDTTLTSLGDAYQPGLAVRNARGAELARDAVIWSSSREAVALVGPDGMVVAADSGEARITASYGDFLVDAINVLVRNVPDSIWLAGNLDTLTALGQRLAYHGEVWNARRNVIPGYRITWESTNPTAVAVADSGWITGVGLGTAWIRGRAGTAVDSIQVVVVNPTLVHVDNSVVVEPRFGTLKRPYRRIQDGVDAIDAGDTVFVHVGMGKYPESVALVRQTVLLGDSVPFWDNAQDPQYLPRIAHDTGWAGITAYTSAPQRIEYLAVLHTLDGPAIDAVGSDVRVRRFHVNPWSIVTSRIGRGISIRNSVSGSRVEHSFVYAVRGYGIRLEQSAGARVSNDSVWSVDSMPGGESGGGIQLVGGSNHLVQGNVVRRTQGPQIEIDASEGARIFGNDLRGAIQLIQIRNVASGLLTQVNVNHLNLNAYGELTDANNPPAAIDIRESPGNIILANDTLTQTVPGPWMYGVRLVNAKATLVGGQVRGMWKGVVMDTSTAGLDGVTIDSVRLGIEAGGTTQLWLTNSTLRDMQEGSCLTLYGNQSHVEVRGTAFVDCRPEVDPDPWAAVQMYGAASRFQIDSSTFQGRQPFAVWFGQLHDGVEGGTAMRFLHNTVSGPGDHDIGSNWGAAVQGGADTVVITGNSITDHRDTGGAGVYGGLYLAGGQYVRVDSNHVSRNSIGMFMQPLPWTLEVVDNDFYDNVTVGFRHDEPWLVTLENNWWGDARGPRRDADPAAVGDSIAQMANADFGPYRAAPVYPGTMGASLRTVRGDDQSAGAGTPLPRAFTVRVVDDEGRPVAGVTVTFTVTAGGGTIDDGVTTGETTLDVVSDASGLAEVTLTTGASPGTNTVTAIGVAQTVTFTATGI